MAENPFAKYAQADAAVAEPVSDNPFSKYDTKAQNPFLKYGKSAVNSGKNLATKLLDYAQQPTNLKNQAIIGGMPLDRNATTTGSDVIQAAENMSPEERMKWAISNPIVRGPIAAVATGINAVMPEDRSKLEGAIQGAAEKATLLPGVGLMGLAGGTLAAKAAGNPEAAFGFGLDAITDPLNLVGPAAETKLGKAVIGGVKAGVKTTGFKMFELAPKGLQDALKATQRRFVAPIHRVEKAIADLYKDKMGDVNQATAELEARAQQQFEYMKKSFGDKKPMVDAQVSEAIERGDLSKLDAIAGDPVKAKELKSLAQAKMEQFKAELALKKKAGIYAGEVEDLGYMPHIATKEVLDHKQYERIAAFMGMDKELHAFNPSQLKRKLLKPDGSNYSIAEANELFRKGKFPGLEDVKINRFFHDDPIFAGALSAYRTEAQVAAKGLYDGLKAFRLPKDAAGTTVDATVNGINVLEGMKFKPEVAELIDKTKHVLFNDEISNAYRKIVNVWKGIVTATPQFNLRNAITNFISNAVEGVTNPRFYTTAGDIQTGKKGVVKGTKIDFDDVRTQYAREGLDKGAFNEDFGRNLHEKLNPAPFKEKGLYEKFQHVMKPARDVSQGIEKNAKMAHFIAKLEEGKSFREAADSVKKTLFDYNDLTDFEKTTMKDWMPFYTWMRKNIPRQFEIMLKKPTYLSRQSQVATNVEAGDKLTNRDRQVTPDYFDELLAFSVGKNDKTGRRLFASVATPLSDLTRIKTDPDKSFMANLIDTGRDYMGGVTPFAKYIGEEIADRNLFSGRELAADKSGDLGRAPAYLELLPKAVQKAMGIKVDKRSKNIVMNKHAAHFLDSLTNVPQLRAVGKLGKENSTDEEKAFALMAFITGVKIMPEDMNKNAMYHFKEKITERRNKLKDRKRFREVK